jgi:hypothetical protein
MLEEGDTSRNYMLSFSKANQRSLNLRAQMEPYSEESLKDTGEYAGHIRRNCIGEVQLQITNILGGDNTSNLTAVSFKQ